MDIIKDILFYWSRQIFKNVGYTLICIIIGLVVLYCSNSFPRYIDSWL